MNARFLAGVGLFALVMGSGCEPPKAVDTAPPPGKVEYVDISPSAGIRFAHHSGARGKKYMPETVGSGCAILDYNGDGRMDLFYVNSTDWPAADARKHYPALYRNDGGGRFTDVTRAAGLLHDAYGMGACAADYDNDGDTDLFVSCIGPNRLYRNDGSGRFTEVTRAAGVAGAPVEPGGLRWKWSSSAAWVDYDRDGRLDLFVANYVKWTPATDPFCGRDGRKAYCAPHNFEGVPSLLYHNLGSGRFKDVSVETGIADQVGKSFGVAVADYNADGWPDLAVSNDTSENFLFLNQEGRRFAQTALEAGIALSAGGVARAGMGIDAADWRNDGRFGLIVGNFSREGLALFENDGTGLFKDVSYPAKVGESSLLSLTFGVFFFDFDLDGQQDIFAANGHIDDFVQTQEAMITYEQLPLLYRGRSGIFASVGPESGPALAEKRVLRGCAHGDMDDDGDRDIAVVWNNKRGELWRNDGGNAGNWIGLSLRGTRSNRDGIGALVRVKSGTVTQTATRHSGGSFLSENDPRMVFGLGSARQAESIEITWPSGQVSRYASPQAGKYYVAEEGFAQLQPVEPGSAVSDRP